MNSFDQINSESPFRDSARVTSEEMEGLATESFVGQGTAMRSDLDPKANPFVISSDDLAPGGFRKGD